MSVNVNQLFGTMQEEGDLSQAATLALTGIVDLGQQIQAAMGTPAEQMESSEVVIVTALVDDSFSIKAARSEDFIRSGMNSIVSALKQSKQSGDVLMSVRYLNGKLLYPYNPLDQAVLLDNKNYNANGGTPLYDQTLVTLASVLAKTKEFADNGIPVRTITVIVTDGCDEHSKKEAHHCEPVITDMLMSENHIVCAMGIGNDPNIKQTFNRVFVEMGVRPEYIITPDNSESELRKAFAVVSQSAVRVSQATGANVSQIGGFGI